MHNYFLFINYSFHGFKYVVCLQMIGILEHKNEAKVLIPRFEGARSGPRTHTKHACIPLSEPKMLMYSLDAESVEETICRI